MKRKKTLISLSCIMSISMQLFSPIFAASYTVDDYDGNGTPIPTKVTGDILLPEEVNSITDVLRGIIHDDGGTAWDNGVEGTTDDTLNIQYDLTSTGTICDSNGCIGSSDWDSIADGGINFEGGTIGNVGIGLDKDTEPPLAKLHINKTLTDIPLYITKGLYSSFISPLSVYEFAIGSGADYWGIDAGTDFRIGNNSDAEIFNIDSSGNVGIGEATPVSKLDVNGGIKFGEDTDICDATKAGTTRYNSSSNVLELCNGTAWNEMGSGGGSSSLPTCTDGQILEYDTSTSAWICGDSSGGSAFIKCTNEQSDGDGTGDVTGCVEAATIGVSPYTIGTNNYIQLSCTISGGTTRLTGRGAKFVSNRWQKYAGSSWEYCDDGSMIIMNLNSTGGTGGGSVYTSPEQTITSAGNLTLAHGLGAEPKFVQVYLVNKIAELGYLVGDKTIISSEQRVTSGTAHGFSLSFDSTNINIRIGDSGLRIVNKTTGGSADITNNNWKLVVVASTGVGSGSGSSTLLGLTDTVSSFVSNAISFVNSAGDALSQSANLIYDGTNLTVSNGGISTDSLAISGGMAVDTDTLYVDQANDRVGIGTTSPEAKLYIKGDDLYHLILKDSGDTGNNAIVHIRGRDNANNDLWFLGDAWDASGNVALSNLQTGGDLIFRTENTDRVTIGNTGNVGIGTTSPNSKLEVAGNIKVGIDGTTPGKITFFNNTAETMDPHIAASSKSGGAGNDLEIKTNSTNGSIYLDATGHINFQTNSVDKMVILENGNVGIGTTTPSYKLDVNGDVRGTSWTNSDIRLKEQIETIPSALGKIKQIRGVSYFWKDKTKNNKKQLGVIAQEVEKVFPELVNEDNEGIKSVSYTSLVSPLIEAIKELAEKVENLFDKMINQQQDIEELKTRLDKQEKEIADLKKLILEK